MRSGRTVLIGSILHDSLMTLRDISHYNLCDCHSRELNSFTTPFEIFFLSVVIWDKVCDRYNVVLNWCKQKYWMNDQMHQLNRKFKTNQNQNLFSSKSFKHSENLLAYSLPTLTKSMTIFSRLTKDCKRLLHLFMIVTLQFLFLSFLSFVKLYRKWCAVQIWCSLKIISNVIFF